MSETDLPAPTREALLQAAEARRWTFSGLDEIIAEAEYGLAVKPGGPTNRSHLGVDPALRTAALGSDFEHLTGLLSVDLRELPDVRCRDLFPADGWLVFFADLREHPSVTIDEATQDSGLFAVRHVPDTEPSKLARRPLRLDPVLTLPDGWQLEERHPSLQEEANLDRFEDLYDMQMVTADPDGLDPDRPTQILGHTDPVAYPGPTLYRGEIMLLQFAAFDALTELGAPANPHTEILILGSMEDPVGQCTAWGFSVA